MFSNKLKNIFYSKKYFISNNVSFFYTGFFRFLIIISQVCLIKIISNFLSLNQLAIYYWIQALIIGIHVSIFQPNEYFRNSRMYDYFNQKRAIFHGINFEFIFLLIIFFIIQFADKNYLDVLNLDIHFLYLIALNAISMHLSASGRSAVSIIKSPSIGVAIYSLEMILKLLLLFIISSIKALTVKNIFLISSMVPLLSFILSIFYLRNFNIKIFSFRFKSIFSLKINYKFLFPLMVSGSLGWGASLLAPRLSGSLFEKEMFAIFTTVTGITQAAFAAIISIYVAQKSPGLYKNSISDLIIYLRNGLYIFFCFVFLWLPFSNFAIRIISNPEFVSLSYIALSGAVFELIMFFIGGVNIKLQQLNCTFLILRGTLVMTLITIISLMLIWETKLINPLSLSFIILFPAIVALFHNSISLYKRCQKV